jgi:hypothetical protein
MKAGANHILVLFYFWSFFFNVFPHHRRHHFQCRVNHKSHRHVPIILDRGVQKNRTSLNGQTWLGDCEPRETETIVCVGEGGRCTPHTHSDTNCSKHGLY